MKRWTYSMEVHLFDLYQQNSVYMFTGSSSQRT